MRLLLRFINRIFTSLLFITALFFFQSLKFQDVAIAYPLNPESNISYVHVFFDQTHSFVEKNNTFISTNYISIDPHFSTDVTRTVYGSEHFCKNIFYFSDDKIIFYNPSQYMDSYVWCQVQLTHKKLKKLQLTNLS